MRRFPIGFVKGVEKEYQKGAASVVGVEIQLRQGMRQATFWSGSHVETEGASASSMSQESAISAGSPYRKLYERYSMDRLD